MNWRNQSHPAHQSHGQIPEKIYVTSADLTQANWVLQVRPLVTNLWLESITRKLRVIPSLLVVQGAITTCLNLNPGFSLSAQDDAGIEARSMPPGLACA